MKQKHGNFTPLSFTENQRQLGTQADIPIKIVVLSRMYKNYEVGINKSSIPVMENLGTLGSNILDVKRDGKQRVIICRTKNDRALP